MNLLDPDSPEELLRTTNITLVEQEHIDRMNVFASNGSSYIFEHGIMPTSDRSELYSNDLASVVGDEH